MKRIELKVIAGAKKEEIIEISPGNYKIKVTKAPEKGKANKRIIEIIAEKFKVKKSSIRILSGETSSKKIIGII